MSDLHTTCSQRQLELAPRLAQSVALSAATALAPIAAATMPPKKRAAASTSTSKASRKKPAAAPALSAEHESLAQLYAATLTVAGFLAPKGVPCTLDRLVGPVRALGQTLTHAALKQIVSIDDRLVLRSFVGPTGESQPLLVMREQLKLVATPAAVRARDRRFRELLQAHAAAAPAAAAPAAGASTADASPSHAAAAVAAASSDELGLPSPPPKPLRRVVSSELEEATAQDGMHPMQPPEAEAAATPGPSAATSAAAAATPATAATPVDRALAELRGSSFYRGQVCHFHETAARPPRYAQLTRPLAPAVRAAMAAAGLDRLYSHQAAAVDAVLGGGHVMLCTPTASGKSLGYNLPALHALATDASARCLYLFPTKALAQDQLRALRALSSAGATSLFGVRVDTYDGDTPQAERPDVRAHARVIITNPDMLHCALLPGHAEWAHVLASLRLIVVDEAHMYRGVFGSHVASILRRLRRLAAMHGASPSVVCCSATVGNPRDLFEGLTGVADPLVLTEDGSPHGRRRLLMWNPPVRAMPTVLPPGKGVPQPDDDDQEEGGASLAPSYGATYGRPTAGGGDDGPRQSSNIEAAVLFAELVRIGLKVICFCSVRKICELVLDYTRQHLRSKAPELAPLVGAYRGGLTAAERRRIEGQLFDGRLRGVSATSSLELGVDIRSLDAVVILGFPGSVAAMWQRAGRCGREASSDALCILVAYPSAIDQWAMRHPRRLLGMPVEAAFVDLDNQKVLQAQLLCAAAEEPLDPAVDGPLWGAERFAEAVAALKADDKLIELPNGALRADLGGAVSAAHGSNIRSIETDHVTVLVRRLRRPDQTMPQCLASSSSAAAGSAAAAPAAAAASDEGISWEEIDQVERWRVHYELYEGAVYLNQGRKFIVKSLDYTNGVAYLEPSTVRYYTRSVDVQRIVVLQRIHSSPLPLADAATTEDDGAGASSSSSAAAAAAAEGAGTHIGRVRVRLTVDGYIKIWQKTGEIFEEAPLSLPPYTYDTRGVWVDVPEVAAAELVESGVDVDAGLHAAAHAVCALLPLHLRCEAGDVGCECDALRKRALRSKRLLLFDRGDGGLGISQRVHGRLAPLLRDALRLIEGCGCADGCWCCVHSSKCLEYNAGTDKAAAVAVLRRLLEPVEPVAAAEPAVAAAGPQCEECEGGAPGGDVGGVSMLGRSIERFRHLR